MNNRIALFSPSMAGGGAERIMLTLARGFTDLGLDVDLVLAQAKGSYLKEIPESVKIVDLKSRRVSASLPGLIKYLRNTRPAAILSSQNYANVIAIWAVRFSRAGTRIIIREENMAENDPGIRNRIVLYLMRKYYPWAQGIVAVSEGVKSGIVRITRINPHLVSVIYNPIIIKELRKISKEPVDHPWFMHDKPPIVLGVGRLVWHKDFATLIRAFALVRKLIPAKLLILGEGEKRVELENLVKTLGLGDDVSMPGFVENPYAFMSRSDVYVLSSVSEGLPTSLLEAMAVNTPVVATDCESGPREILSGGEYGQLVRVGDCKALATAILNVIQHKKYPEPPAECLANFSLDKCLANHMHLMINNINYTSKPP